MTTKTHPVEQVSERARVFRAGYSARKKIYGYGRSDALPEGMNPWRGGDSAPEDWDGGRVLLADGKSYCEKPKDWRASAPYRIIAYTPKSTPASHTAPDALRSELVARAALNGGSDAD